MMASVPKILTHEEFGSLLTVGKCSILDPPAAIPAQHSARLIALGYMVDLSGRLRMTTPGRQRIAAGFEQESRSVDSGVEADRIRRKDAAVVSSFALAFEFAPTNIAAFEGLKVNPTED
jgi:hypothetical protein